MKHYSRFYSVRAEKEREMPKRKQVECSTDDTAIFANEILVSILELTIDSAEQICTLLRVCKRWNSCMLEIVGRKPRVTLVEFFTKYAFSQIELNTIMYLDMKPNNTRICIDDTEATPDNSGTWEVVAFCPIEEKWDQGVVINMGGLFPGMEHVKEGTLDVRDLRFEEFCNVIRVAVDKRDENGGVYVNAYDVWIEYSPDAIIKRVYDKSPHTRKMVNSDTLRYAYYLPWKHFEERIASNEIQWTLHYGKYR